MKSTIPSYLALIACTCAITIGLVSAAWCGNLECEVGENCSWCAYDCGTCDEWKVYQRCINPKHIALTFDDGPNEWTDRILDALKAKNATATFFFLGWKLSYASRMKRAADEGHTIGSHSMNHPNLATLSIPSAMSEVWRMISEIEQVTGVRPRWFRPPYGSFTRELNNELHKAGQRVVLWNLDPLDWEDPLSYQLHTFEYWLNATSAQGGGGFITVQHGNTQDAVAAISYEVDMVRAHGYEIVSMDTCTGYPVFEQDPNWIPPTDAALMNGPNPFLLICVLLFLLSYLV